MTFLRTATALVAALMLVGCQTSPATTKPSVGFSQPILVPIKYQGREKYQLARDWEWEWCGNVEKAPAGLVIDGASVPRIGWPFMPPDGLHRAAATAHDVAYIGRGNMPSGLKIHREEADLMFYSLMLRGGVSNRRAAIAYHAVRGFGWKEWNKPYVGPVIIPVQQPLTSKPKKTFFLSRHIYE